MVVVDGIAKAISSIRVAKTMPLRSLKSGTDFCERREASAEPWGC